MVKFGDKHLLNEFVEREKIAQMSWKTLYNKMTLAKSFDGTRKGFLLYNRD